MNMFRYLRCILAAAGVLAFTVNAAMADGTINSLSAAAALSGTDKIPVSQAADPAPAVFTTPTAISTFVNAHLPTGTVGATIPLNNGGFTQSGVANFTGGLQIGGVGQTFPTSGLLVGTTDTQTLSGKTLTNPTINGATLSGTLAGTPTFSGVPLFSGLSAGTQVACLGLDVGNHLVTLASACGSGSGGSGTVTSVALALPGIFTVTGSPITTSGTLTGTLASQSQNLVFASPASGSGAPTFRALTSADLPPLSTNTKTATYTVAPSDMGNALVLAATTGTPSLTLPVASSTYFAPGMTLGVSIPKITSGVNWTLTNSTGLTLRGLNSTTLLPGTQGVFVANADGVTLDFFPGMQVATTTSLGGVIPDGTTITIANGVISAATGGTGCTVSGAAGILLNSGSSTCTTDTSITASAGALTGVTSLASTATTVTQAVNDNSTKIATTAYADRPVPTAAGTTHSFTGKADIYLCTGACTMSVPVPVAGVQYCAQNDVGVSSVITFSSIGSSAMYGKTDQSVYGTAGTGTAISGGATGDRICFIGKDSTHYNVASSSGTWTMN